MRSVLLSALSGCLIGIVFCVPALSFLAWGALVPFFYILKNVSFRTGMLSSAIFAFCYYGIAMFWINHVTVPGYIMLMAYLSLHGVIFFLITRYFFQKPFRIFTISSAWVAIELLKEQLWPHCGWAQMGYTQFRYLSVIQAADIGGVKLISWLIVMANAVILELMSYVQAKAESQAKRKLFLVNLCTAILIAIGFFAYAPIRMANLSSIDKINISVIQPNIPEAFKYNPVMSPVVIASLRLLGSQAQEDALTIYPEAAWPLIIDDGKRLTRLIKETGKMTLIGAVDVVDGRYYNSALFFNKDGRLLKRYHKIKLVPYGEYVPLRKFLTFIDAVNNIGDMSFGDELVLFDYRNKRFSVLICFEDVFPLFVREAAAKSDFLVNITNDGWFYGEPQASQHMAVMTLRAVENRIPIIRAANTGISGWVSSTGVRTSLSCDDTGLFCAGTETFAVALTAERSIYTKHGDFFAFACCGFLGLFFIADRGMKRRHAGE